MNQYPRKITAQQWCHTARQDNAVHSLLIIDALNASFYGGQSPDKLGGKDLNTFSVGFHTDGAFPAYCDKLFLSFFENALYDYTYHTVYIDLPDRLNDAQTYRDGICAMLDLLSRYQPQAKLVWVDSGDESAIGRALIQERGGRYLDMRGKALEDLNKEAALIAAETVAQHKEYREGALTADQLAQYKEPMYWCIHDMADYKNGDTRPRVLLIGDSICFGYYRPTRALLEKDFIVDTYAMSFAPADPCVLRNLMPILRAHHYDAIHINVGMHQCPSDTCEGGYEKAVCELLSGIRSASPETRICFATTTTIMKQDNLNEFDDQTFGWVTNRNQAACRVCAEMGLPMDDLFTLCVEKKPEKADTHHFKDSTLLARQVADSVKSLFA